MVVVNPLANCRSKHISLFTQCTGRENNPNICKQLWHVVALQFPGKNRKVLGQLPLVFWLLSKICPSSFGNHPNLLGQHRTEYLRAGHAHCHRVQWQFLHKFLQFYMMLYVQSDPRDQIIPLPDGQSRQQTL